MDRSMLLDHLAQNRRHIEIGERHISRQREIVAELERGGYDSSRAKQLLHNFEELQKMHIAGWGRQRDWKSLLFLRYLRMYTATAVAQSVAIGAA
jgi:hypothetical protein